MVLFLFCFSTCNSPLVLYFNYQLYLSLDFLSLIPLVGLFLLLGYLVELIKHLQTFDRSDTNSPFLASIQINELFSCVVFFCISFFSLLSTFIENVINLWCQSFRFLLSFQKHKTTTEKNPQKSNKNTHNIC